MTPSSSDVAALERLPSAKGVQALLDRVAMSMAVPGDGVIPDDVRQLHQTVSALAAEIARLERALIERRGPERGSMGEWPQEVRDAIDALEDRYDISLVSSDHHERHVNRADRLEAEVSRLREALERIEPFLIHVKDGTMNGNVRRGRAHDILVSLSALNHPSDKDATVKHEVTK